MEEKYPKRGSERLYLIAFGGDYDHDVSEFKPFKNKGELATRIKELLNWESSYNKDGIVREENIHVIYGREVPFIVEKEKVKEITFKERP